MFCRIFILKSFKTQVQEFIKDKEKGHGKQKDLRGSFINTKLNHIMVKAILAQLVTVKDIACKHNDQLFPPNFDIKKVRPFVRCSVVRKTLLTLILGGVLRSVLVKLNYLAAYLCLLAYSKPPFE